MDEEEPPELCVALIETTTVTGDAASTFTPTLYGKLGRNVLGAIIVYDGVLKAKLKQGLIHVLPNYKVPN